MARQTVGNPKFYIDLLSYWWAKGMVTEVGYPDASDYAAGGEHYRPQFIGLNPTDYVDDVVNFNPSQKITIDLGHYVHIPEETADKFFVGFFGHNFYTSEFSEPMLKLINSTDPTNNTLLKEYDDFSEICNWASHSPFGYNGWSLGEWTGGDSDKFNRIEIQFNAYVLEGANTPPVNVNRRIILGSLGFGQVFQMPHSPDLNLRIVRDYKGITNQVTKGGSTLTQINYSGTPNWAGSPAWELNQDDYDGAVDNRLIDKRAPARGRRAWDLNFSYIGGNDLFPLNEMLSTSNPTDSSTEAGYDSAEFVTNTTNFNTGAMQDTSFMAMLMDRTIGGALPFVFQPDGNNNSPDQFALCVLNQDSISFEQVANNVYDVKLEILEVW